MRKKYWRKYHVDEHAFDTIDTEHKAYMLGFIAADGYVGKDGLHFTLHRRDERDLHNLLDILQSNHPIRDVGRNRVAVDVSSRILARRLAELGLKSPKTFTMPAPREIPENLLHHWLRGYWDGDGWLGTSKRANGYSPLVAVAGWSHDTMEFISQLCALYCESPVKLSTYQNRGWLIKFEAQRAHDWLGQVYLPAKIALSRKLRRAQEIYTISILTLSQSQQLRREREYQAHYALRNAEIKQLRQQGWKLADLSRRFNLGIPRICAITKSKDRVLTRTGEA